MLSDLNLGIEEVTKEAFFVLGHNGLISAANQTGQLPEGKLGKRLHLKIRIPNGFTILLCQKERWKITTMPGLLIFK